MSPVMEAVTETEKTAAGGAKKPPSTAMLRLDLQKSVNSSMRRCRAVDGSFR
jgi:hypothetical protein